jgi:hypothetical protein
MKSSSRGIIRLYCDSGSESLRLLKRHWLIIPASVGLIVGWMVITQIIGSLFGGSLISGFILGLLQAAMIGTFYSWLHDIALNRTPSWREFRYETFVSVISIGFFLYLIQLGSHAFQSGGEFGALVILFIQLAVVIWCNPAPEIIQHIQPDGMNGVMLCYEFMKEHGAAWLGAMILVMSPILILTPLEGFLITISSLNPVFPFAGIATSWMSLSTNLLIGLVPHFAISMLAILISSLLGIWIMIFRSVLFQRLAGRG